MNSCSSALCGSVFSAGVGDGVGLAVGSRTGVGVASDIGRSVIFQVWPLSVRA